MLKAMQEQLKGLAQDKDGQFHLILRERVGKRATEILETRLKRIIVLMPDLITQLYVYWAKENASSTTKRLASYLLTYLYAPKDYLSESDFGLFGYLDDAYFVAKMYTTVIQDIQVSGGKVRALDLKLFEEVLSLKKDIRIVILKESKQIDQLIEDLLIGKQESYTSLIEQ
jgi:uncharacterized membrane protein YkvA (DUF1232 family)